MDFELLSRILADSWEQNSAGFHIVERATGARAEIVDFWAVVFTPSPSFLDRISHVIMGAWQAAVFVLFLSIPIVIACTVRIYCIFR